MMNFWEEGEEEMTVEAAQPRPPVAVAVDSSAMAPMLVVVVEGNLQGVARLREEGVNF